MSAAKAVVGNTYIARRVVRLPQLFPTIVYVCRPKPATDEDEAAVREIMARETLEGCNMVVGCYVCQQLHFGMHQFFIDLADEVVVINRGGRVDEEQAREIEYARGKGKVVRYT
ncbi:MAG TPA: hypothetical protein VIP46_02685 [Pyrinomonadaceae bacterium]